MVDDCHSRLNHIDQQLLSLLNQRAEVSSELALKNRDAGLAELDLQHSAADLDRLEVLQHVSDGAFPQAALRPVFREINAACLSLQQAPSVAYLGPPGTFTQMAARSLFGSTGNYTEANTIAAVFDAVVRKTAHFGVVPIENSSEGGVNYTLDCLIEYDVCIQNELVLDVAQCLVARHTDLASIEQVYSHPHGLAQCRTWLATHLPQAELVVSPSTSAAARKAATDARVAAVASRLAAELHGLELVRDNIQDRIQNATRFVVLALTDSPPTGKDKTSLVFSTAHKKGALRSVLEIFDEEGLNLTRIESRPYGSRLWEYAFFADLEGHRAEPAVTKALARLNGVCGRVRTLGSYPRATHGQNSASKS